MKWLEIRDDTIDEVYLLNLSHVVRIWMNNQLIFISLGGDPYEICSESKAECRIKYELIKSFINHGQISEGLSIKSD